MKPKLDKKSIVSFFPFVALAMLFWVSSIMTKKSTYSKDIFVKITTDEDYIIVDTAIYTANVTLAGKGLDLISVNSYSKKKPLVVNISHREQKLTADNISKALEREISTNKIQILKVLFPDTGVNIEKKRIKYVPVRFNGTLEFKKMFGLKGEIVFDPEKLMVSGPESMVDGINYWKTEYKEYSDIDKDIKGIVNLEKPKSLCMTLKPEKVEIYIPVEEFTEKKLRLPVKISGVKNKDLKITPSYITISFVTGVSKYEYIDSSSFLASVYLHKDSTLNGNFPVSIIKKPSDVSIQYIQPNYVNVYLKN